MVEEIAAIDKRQEITGIVDARTEMREKALIVDGPLLAEEVIIERVLMDRGIDHPL